MRFLRHFNSKGCIYDPVSAMNASRRQVLQTLAQRIQEIESACHSQDRTALSLGISALEDLLPEQRLPAGSLLELLSAAEGTGVWTLALLMAKNSCGTGKALVVADAQRCFYPPAAAKLGIDLDRLILLRPTAPRDLHAAIEQSLRCTAVGAVVGWCDRLSGVDGRRLQLAAELGGGVGFLLRPAAALRSPSFAALRLLVAPMPPADSALGASSALGAGLRPRRLAVEVIRCRGGKDGQSLILEIDDETGDVRVPSRVASAAPGARATRASG